MNSVNSQKELLKTVSTRLTTDIPTAPTQNIESPSASLEEIITQANIKAGDIINNAKAAVLLAYINNENARTERQQPLFNAIKLFTGIQLGVFNVIVVLTVVWSFINGESGTIVLMFDILKYYMGATVVELIGMVVYIVSVTFSKDHMKIMKLVYGDELKAKTK